MPKRRELPFSYGVDLQGQVGSGSARRPEPAQPQVCAARPSGGGWQHPRSQSGRGRPAPRHLARGDRRRPWIRRVLVGVGAAGVLSVLIVGAMGLFLLVKLLRIERIANVGVDEVGQDEPRNYLVVGSDVRPDGDEIGGQRSDSVVVLRVEPGGGQVTVLSIPRDLVVPISGTGRTDRINSAYAVSRATLVDTVRDNLGIELHHYVEVDFPGFEALVDRAGGVPIWTSAAIKDEQSGLYVPDLGCVVLDGNQALAYVRSRELQYMRPEGYWSAPDPSADLGRVERQQTFMRRALDAAVGEAKANPAQIPHLVDEMASMVAVDDQMSVRSMIDLANRLRDFDTEHFETYTLPVAPRDDGATLALDSEEAEPILDLFRGVTSSGGDGDAPGTRGTTDLDVGEPGGAADGTREDEPGDPDPPEPAVYGPAEFQIGEPPPGQGC